MKADLIIENIAQLVTCKSNGKAKHGAEMQNLDIVENGAVAVKDGKIIAVETTHKLRENVQSDDIIDAKNKVVCPAFVDPHTHIVFGGNRLNEFELRIKGASYLEIMESGGGIISTVSRTRNSDIEGLVKQSRKRLDEMLKCGTATVEIKTGYGLDTATEIKMLEAIAELDKTSEMEIVPTFLGAHAIPKEFLGREDDFTNLICEEMLPKAWNWFEHSHFYQNKTPFFADVFCEKNAFNLEQSKKVLKTAKNLGFAIKAHVDEFTNLGCAEFAIKIGATSIDHLDQTSDAEIELLAKSETIGVLTPTVNFNFGSTEFADARKMIDKNCAIAVSTDYNPGSAPCPSPPLTMAIACRYQKLTPAEALNAATINSAFAIGLGKTHSSIEVGKFADLLVLDTDDYRQVSYEFGRNFVESVIKKGKTLF